MRASLTLLVVLTVILSVGVTPSPRAQGADDGAGSGTSLAPGIVLGGDITLSGARDSVLALAGSIVVSDAHMGNVAVAGGGVQMVSGDIGRLAVAGGTVNLDGGQLGDMAAAAGDLKINSHVSGDLRAAAGTIVLTKDTVVGGDADLAGGDIAIDGAIGHNLAAQADHISLAGTIGGSVSLKGDDITIAPGTHIGGNLSYTGPSRITVPPDVSVGGKVLQRLSDKTSNRNRRHTMIPDDAARTLSIVGLGGLVLCGIVLVLAMPALLTSTEAILVHAFPISLVTGLIAACLLPLAVVVLMVTVIGIPVALVAMAASAAVTGFGLLAVCRWVGDVVRRRLGQPDPPVLARRVGWVAVGFVAFAAVGVIPLVGWLVQGIAMLAAAGAAILALWRRPWAKA